MAIDMDDDVAGDMAADADVDYHVDADITVAVYFFDGPISKWATNLG
jgi:hypothetical protein